MAHLTHRKAFTHIRSALNQQLNIRVQIPLLTDYHSSNTTVGDAQAKHPCTYFHPTLTPFMP